MLTVTAACRRVSRNSRAWPGALVLAFRTDHGCGRTTGNAGQAIAAAIGHSDVDVVPSRAIGRRSGHRRNYGRGLVNIERGADRGDVTRLIDGLGAKAFRRAFAGDRRGRRANGDSR